MVERIFKFPKEGVLKRFGYQVGARGPMRRERQNILNRVFAYAGALEIGGSIGRNGAPANRPSPCKK